MNTERPNSSESSATRPRPTRIERIAISTGTSPATTAPKTRRSTTSAAGSPNSSSPCSRSLWDSVLKSFATVWSPVIATANPGVRLACCTSGSTRLIAPSLFTES